MARGQGASIQGRDGANRLSGTHAIPVVPEFGPVLGRPLENQSQNTPGQMSCFYFQGIQADHRFLFGVTCVEVRWLVVIPIHRDHDAEEAAKP